MTERTPSRTETMRRLSGKDAASPGLDSGALQEPCTFPAPKDRRRTGQNVPSPQMSRRPQPDALGQLQRSRWREASGRPSEATGSCHSGAAPPAGEVRQAEEANIVPLRGAGFPLGVSRVLHQTILAPPPHPPCAQESPLLEMRSLRCRGEGTGSGSPARKRQSWPRVQAGARAQPLPAAQTRV